MENKMEAIAGNRLECWLGNEIHAQGLGFIGSKTIQKGNRIGI